MAAMSGAMAERAAAVLRPDMSRSPCLDAHPHGVPLSQRQVGHRRRGDLRDEGQRTCELHPDTVAEQVEVRDRAGPAVAGLPSGS